MYFIKINTHVQRKTKFTESKHHHTYFLNPWMSLSALQWDVQVVEQLE